MRMLIEFNRIWPVIGWASGVHDERYLTGALLQEK